jgi:cation transport regulator ChaC
MEIGRNLEYLKKNMAILKLSKPRQQRTKSIKTQVAKKSNAAQAIHHLRMVL